MEPFDLKRVFNDYTYKLLYRRICMLTLREKIKSSVPAIVSRPCDPVKANWLLFFFRVDIKISIHYYFLSMNG